jgi:hypothetical protein
LRNYMSSIASGEAAHLFALQPYLGRLNDRLVAAEEPQPAIAVSLGTTSLEAELPETYIAYGLTEVGQDLRAVKNADQHGALPYARSVGLALPIDRDTLTSATYFPLDYREDLEAELTSTIGWWQQWRSDQFVGHVPGQEPDVIDAPGGDAIGDEPFTSWYRVVTPSAPPILDETSAAVEEAERATMVVRELPGVWKDLHKNYGQTRQHFIVLGKGPVAAALETIREKVNGGDELPQPLTDMLGTIATDLGLSK